MTPFTPSQFFDLSLVDFAPLFNEEEDVWHVLTKLKQYILSCPLGKIEGIIEEGAFLVNPELISIGKGTIVEAGAYIRGPCVIGKECQIRHGAYIRGNLLTGDRCVIGHASEVKNSILLYQAQASHFAYVGDSILGSYTNLGAGTKCANLRFDKKMIQISTADQRKESGLRKLGLILGDYGETGCNSVTNPGTIMGKRSRSYPCVTVSGVVDLGHVVKTALPFIGAL